MILFYRLIGVSLYFSSNWKIKPDLRHICSFLFKRLITLVSEYNVRSIFQFKHNKRTGPLGDQFFVKKKRSGYYWAPFVCVRETSSPLQWHHVCQRRNHHYSGTEEKGYKRSLTAGIAHGSLFSNMLKKKRVTWLFCLSYRRLNSFKRVFVRPDSWDLPFGGDRPLCVSGLVENSLTHYVDYRSLVVYKLLLKIVSVSLYHCLPESRSSLLISASPDFPF